MTTPEIAVQGAAWTPGAEVTHHNGDDLIGGRAFLDPPPDEIGEVVSAHSTLREGKRPWSFTARIALTGLPAGITGGGVRVVGRTLFPNDPISDFWPPLLLGAIVFGIAWYLTRFRHTFSFVGKDGVARFTQSGDLRRPAKQSVLLFADAVALHTSQVKQYVNGVYAATNYDFRWTDSNDTRLLRLNSSYREKKGVCKKVEDAFHFAAAAEASWTAYLLRSFSDKLEQNGSIRFDLTRDRWVRIGIGFIEFHLGEEDVRVETDDIRDLSINKGTFRVVHKDASRLGRKGKFSFDNGDLANARAFLVALETLWGVDLN